MLRMFAEMAGGHVVRSSVKRNPTLGSATGHYAALRVVTSCTDDVLRTVVVNRDAQQPVATRLSLPRPVAGRVDVSTVNGASIESFNTPEHPDDVALVRSHVRADGDTLDYSFEPHSVTMLEYAVRGHVC